MRGKSRFCRHSKQNKQPHKAATEKLEIEHGLWLEYFHREVSFEYIERSCDHWHSDSQTSVYIDEKKAKEIVDFLTEKFNL